jgi:hypothetical protein
MGEDKPCTTLAQRPERMAATNVAGQVIPQDHDESNENIVGNEIPVGKLNARDVIVAGLWTFLTWLRT